MQANKSQKQFPEINAYHNAEQCNLEQTKRKKEENKTQDKNQVLQTADQISQITIRQKQKTENTYNYTKARNRSLRPMRSTKCRRVQKNAKQCNVEQTKRKRYKKHKQLQCQNHFPEINAFYTVAAHCIANTMQNTNTNIYNIQIYSYINIQ